ncbi:helix-turn-helix and ligand-binding sensor domain-containing protein [Salinimicrobium sp. CAU 1759]
MNISKLKMLIAIILPIFSATAQKLSPPIQNFSSIQYKGGSQNWDIDLNEEGIIYAANTQGLLSFDGQRWELFPLESGSIIRSVYPHGDRIYIGSYREFGYWQKDHKGDMCYTSLIPLLGKYELQSEEFWEIIALNDTVYFRSFGAIYRYKGNSLTPVKRINVNQMEVFNGRLVVSVGNSGLFYLEESGDLVPLPGQSLLEGKVVRELIMHEGQLLIGVKDGVFLHDGERLKELKNLDLQKELQQYELNHVLSLGSKGLVIGTLKNGIIYYEQEDEEVQTYNRRDGLQNNTVLSMANRNGKIWLGLDNGIDAVDINSPVEFFTDESGELGSVYDLVYHDNKLYLASNTGVFKLDGNKLELLEGAEGHCWNLQVYDGVMYANHNNGTFQVRNNAFIPISERTGSFQVLERDRGNYFIGNYTGIDLYSEANGEVERLNNVNFPVKKMLVENSETLWATDAYEGIYRIGLSPEGDSTTFVNKITSGNPVGDYNAEVFKFRNQITVLSNGKWYRYNPFKEKLERLNEWQAYDNSRLLTGEEGYFWFLNSEEDLLEITDFEDRKIFISGGMLNNRLVKNHERLVKVNDSIYFISLHDGFASINLEKLKDHIDEEQLSKPVVQKFYDASEDHNLNTVPHISSKEAREVTVLAGLPVSDAVELNYELSGNNSSPVKGKVVDGRIHFQNLPYDEYELKLTAVGSQKNASVLNAFQFVVDPPWYLQDRMKLLYLLLLVLLVVLIYFVNKMKLQKHRQQLQLQYEREHEEKMNKLEKEQLLSEINLKRKELANSTVMAAKKNEVLMQIQGELNKDKEKFSNQYRMKHIMNKINSAVKNDDEWKIFETNFNELHEDFFKDLLAKYPQLTNKDLKLCAYLKMNLSSKEIAPLMGISVRGVEVHRYRLRKKLDVDTAENLTNWLISNF